MFWYSEQVMYVRWGSTISEGLNVSNGVRQGGILSPYLLCVYMDSLSKSLNEIYAGCMVGNVRLNHMMYADDVVLLSPTVDGLEAYQRV